ncbi:unnamed protein product [Ranitomeya imitator]|uniref:Uncharacterized protein n=1 Tax=Ranitomeya imitator TaxID=111125 RepID=A0ABN9KTP4_9NEOB|nr:unnamed protein product [Ranitomeya imitator]
MWRAAVIRDERLGVPPEERAQIEKSFDNLSRNPSKKCVGLTTFQDSLASSLPASMSQRIFHGMQSVDVSGAPAAPEVTREQHAVFIIELLRGTAEEKSALIAPMIGADNSGKVTGPRVQQFLEDLIGAAVHVLHQQNALSGWSLENTRDCNSGGPHAGDAADVTVTGASGGPPLVSAELSSSFSRAAIEDWLYKVPMVSALLRVVVTLGFSVLRQSGDVGCLVPRCRRGKGTLLCQPPGPARHHVPERTPAL